MDKQRLLDKFKLENSLGDEREDYLARQANSYGILFSEITFLLVFIISKVNNLDYTGAKIMFLSLIIGNSFYKYRKNRKNSGKLEKLAYICLIIGGGILYISYIIELVV